MMRRLGNAAAIGADKSWVTKVARSCRFPFAIVAAAGLLTSCVANPGPPPIETGQEAESSAADVARGDAKASSNSSENHAEADHGAKERLGGRRNSVEESQVGIGIDPIHNGLNPHLQANQQAVVDDIAALALPSAFVNGEITELLDSAEEVELAGLDTDAVATEPKPEGTEDQVVAQRVRYEIAQQAQWSDGTPITGEDFIYLWQQMTTTPGVVRASGYFAISDITSTAGGKVVEVAFSQRVHDWQELFHYLLPAHLMNAPFAAVREIPASAGRYQIDSVDWARGKLTLHRNDRFWGADPANIDVIELTEIRNPRQGLDLMRSGQISFADLTPEETTFLAYNSLPGTQVFRFNTPRQMQIDLLTQSPIFSQQLARSEFARLIDRPSVAVQAAGRRTDVRVPGYAESVAHSETGGEEAPRANKNTIDGDATAAQVERLRESSTLQRPLRIAADPTDPVASAAAAAVVDKLVAVGVHAEVVANDFAAIAREMVPNGDVDAVVSWQDTSASSVNLADELLCRAPGLSTEKAAWIPQCLPDFDDAWIQVLEGSVDAEYGLDLVSSLDSEYVLQIPVLDERRIRVLGSGIIGPEEQLERWPAGLKSAPQWLLSTAEDKAGVGGVGRGLKIENPQEG